MSSNTLSPEEVKKVRQRLVRPVVGMASLVAALCLGLFVVVYYMLDDMIFKAETTYAPGFYVYGALALIGVIIFCYCHISTRFGKKNQEEWDAIVEKAQVAQTQKDYTGKAAAAVGLTAAGNLLQKSDNELLQHAGAVSEVAGAVSTVGIAGEQSMETVENARDVAEAFDIPIPSLKKYAIPAFLIPVLVLTAVFVPEFQHSIEVRDAHAQQAATNLYALRDSFGSGCERVSFDDPTDKVQDSYHFFAYLRQRNSIQDRRQAQIYLKVSNTGVITQISYSSDIDMAKTPQENLSAVQNDFNTMQRMLERAGVSAVSDEMISSCKLSDDLVQKFPAGSYYESIYCEPTYTDKIWVKDYFETDPEDEFDESSHPEIVHYVDTK